MSDFAADCEAEKMHTCLPKDETVEGNAHGPQVQRLGESDQRHHFIVLNTHPQPERSNCKREGGSANLFHLLYLCWKIWSSLEHDLNVKPKSD